MIFEYNESLSIRLDLFLTEELERTRSQVKLLISGGAVRMGTAEEGKPLLKAGFLLRPGDRVEVDEKAAARQDPRIEAEDLPLEIVYEDADFVVVNKKQGMTVHPASGVYTGTLVNALLFRFKNLSDLGGECRPGIVHRLDKDTSGLLVVAKNNAAHVKLAKQIEQKTARRCYLALHEGVIKDDAREVQTWISRDPKDRKRMAVSPSGSGKIAVSHMTVATRFEGYTLCRWILGTGRTHQIRVHAKHLRHPIVGDPVYGYARQAFRLSGQLLHAYELTFVHPTTGEEMRFEAPLPDYFVEVLNKLTVRE